MKKIPVGILGATGAVGQRFVELLSNHPWFEIAAFAASERSVGRKYEDAVNWLQASTLEPSLKSLEIMGCLDKNLPKVLFCALDANIASEIEVELLKRGHTIISNTRHHRMLDTTPLLVPEINFDHLELLKKQTSGQIACVPNCSTVGLALALKPLHDKFGIDKLQVVTMQAISGAGYPGVASLDIVDNVIPYIAGEELKLETETLKILGAANKAASFTISAQCNRVAVTDGHTECVSVKFHAKPTEKEIYDAWNDFKGLDLPNAPLKPIWVHYDERYPQPKLHRHQDKGMAVHVGRLRPCPLFDYKFTLLSHNTLRGAAGGGVLIAELMHSHKFL